jgi:hypothetical protein
MLAIVTLFVAYGVLQWAIRTIRTSTLRRTGQNAVHKQLMRGRIAPARRPIVAGSRRTA